MENTTTSTDPVKITTPEGKNVVMLKPYVTARMQLATRGVYLKFVSIDPRKYNDPKNKGKAMSDEDAGRLADYDNIPAEVINEIKNISIEHMVISVDGDYDNILDTILDMRVGDYEFIVSEIDKINEKTTIDDTKKK